MDDSNSPCNHSFSSWLRYVCIACDLIFSMFVQEDYLWTDGTILTHGGDTDLDHAEVWMSIKDNFAVLVTTNIDAANAQMATQYVINTLIPKYLPNQ
jgi:hypothetical protein